MWIVNAGRALAGEPALAPKNGARFHFELPGSVQGFQVEPVGDNPPGVTLENVPGKSQQGQRSLAIRFEPLLPENAVRAATPTFITPGDINMPGYSLYASPTLYPGQTVQASLISDENNTGPVCAQLYVRCYNGEDQAELVAGPELIMTPGLAETLAWRIPDLQGMPIFEIGIEVRADTPTSGQIYIDSLGWEGAPQTIFRQVAGKGTSHLWRKAWVDGVDQWERWGAAFRIIQNRERGLISTGADWTDYQVSAPVKIAMGKSTGIGARVQGTRRFYGLLLCDDQKLRLVKAQECGDLVLGEADCAWELWSQHEFSLQVEGNRIRASLDGRQYFDLNDDNAPFTSGGIALVCEEGHLLVNEVTVNPIP
jgi:hypothetical protein